MGTLCKNYGTNLPNALAKIHLAGLDLLISLPDAYLVTTL